MLVGADLDADEDHRGMRIANGVSLSTSPDLLRRMIEEEEAPARSRLVLGYSGWDAG
jgi:putative AlgH/UPF0301 family transcriptional regulator